MFPTKIFSFFQIVPILSCFLANQFILSTCIEDDGSLFRISRPPENQNWFRVRRQQDEISDSSKQYHRYHDDYPVNQEQDQIETENYGDQPSESVRSRRLYAPPVYTSESPRRPDNYDDDNNHKCKCELEYILKYRGAGSHQSRHQKPGTYHVKVYHEESGHYSEPEEAPTEAPYPVRNHDRGQQDRAPSRSQQQQRPVQYYVEEYVDEPHRERADNIFQRGGGGGGGGGGGPPNRTGSRNLDSERSRQRNEEVVYTSRRNPRKSGKFATKLGKICRQIVGDSDWGTVSIVSGIDSEFGGYPFIQRVRISDGTKNNLTGEPYLYLTASILETNFYDDLENSKVSLTLSFGFENQDFCLNEESMDWRCASVSLMGRIVPVTSTRENEQAADAIVSRHGDRFLEGKGIFAKFVVKNIVLSQNTGSGSFRRVSLNDYFYSR